MKRLISLWLVLCMVGMSSLSAYAAGSGMKVGKLPMKERIRFVQEGGLNTVSEKMEKAHREKIQQMIDSYSTDEIRYTETEAEKAAAQFETTFQIFSGIFKCLPFKGAEAIGSIMDIGASVAGEFKKTDADKTQEMLQQTMERIDARFNIVDEKLNALSYEFNKLNDTNMYYYLMDGYRTDLSQFREQFERDHPTDCAYHDYSDWKKKLRDAYDKVQEAYSNPSQAEFLHERYEKLYLCALEASAIYSYVWEDPQNISDYSLVKSYYDYLILADATHMLECIDETNIAWESVCYANDLYNTYVFSQYCLGISYIYRAEIIDGLRPDVTFVHQEFKSIGKDTILSFFEDCTDNLETVKYELSEDLVYIMALDLSYIYTSDAENKDAYICVPYCSIAEDQTIVYHHQLHKGATIFMNQIPLSMRSICDHSKISFKITEGSALATADNNGKITVTGDSGNFTATVLYNENILYALSFTIAANPFSGGDGSREFPYIIANNQDLSNIRNYSDRHFLLVNDINLSTNEMMTPSENHYYNFITIPQFSGSLDGGGHTISGMEHKWIADSIAPGNEFFLGLIGINSGTIKNLNIRNFNFYQEHSEVGKTRYAYTGFLCGQNTQTGVISHVTVENAEVFHHLGYDDGQYANCLFVGGITGQNHGEIKNCGVKDTVFFAHGKARDAGSHSYVGGIAGRTYGKISDCFSAYNSMRSAAYCGCFDNLFTHWSGYAYAYSGGMVGAIESTGSLSRCLVTENKTNAEVGGAWSDRMRRYEDAFAAEKKSNNYTDLFEYKMTATEDSTESRLPYEGLDISQYSVLSENGWMQKGNGEPCFMKAEAEVPFLAQTYHPKEITDSSITMESLPMYEYAIATCESDMSAWQKTAHFEGLTPATPYKLYVRRVESATAAASASTVPVTIFTEKSNAPMPEAPVEAKTSASEITLKQVDGYEYSLDQRIWQDSNAFENLQPDTEYTLYQRIAETETTYAGETSIGLTLRTDKIGIRVKNNADGDTCTVSVAAVSDELTKTPVMYVAFYNADGTLLQVMTKPVTTTTQQSVVDVPSQSETCKVFLWKKISITPLCVIDVCDIQ